MKEEILNSVFTETTDGMNASLNQLEVNCITSKQNKFHLDSEGNLSVNSITTVVDNGTENSNIDFDSIYPIGAIYMSVDETNPGILFGGTWEQLKDRFLLGASETYEAGSIAGEKEHTLTVSEMPSHTHDLQVGDYNMYLNGGSNNNYHLSWDNKALKDWSRLTIRNTGGSKAHNNMPPYLAVYMWKRVA